MASSRIALAHLSALVLLLLNYLSAATDLPKHSLDLPPHSAKLHPGYGLSSQVPLGGILPGFTNSSTQYWLGEIDHSQSKSIYDSAYVVYRNVKDFGAKGDGFSDDTSAIQQAISSGNRCEDFACQGSTKTPALVYFPPGVYVVSRTLKIGMYTQLAGDAIDWPTLKVTSNFGANVVLDGFPLSSDGKTRWNNNHAELNFHKSVRNLKIDVTAVDSGTAVSCINWPVAQGTSLSSIVFNMNTNSQHLGVTFNAFQGGGSGIFMGDLYFFGGDRALTLSNQQFHFRNLHFNGARIAIKIDSTFVAVFQGIEFVTCGTGIDTGGAGSLTLLDSSANGVGRVIATRETGNGDGSIVIDNLNVTGVASIVQNYSNNRVILPGTDVPITVDTWTQGNVYLGLDDGGYVQRTLSSPIKPDVMLDDGGRFFTRSRPVYVNTSATDIVNVKEQGAKGDGSTDDTSILNSILAKYAGSGKVIYFPHGYYVVTDTLYIPPNSSIVGEVWSTINARGSKFKDENNPLAVVQVGKPGEVGYAELTDMLFETGEILPGAILVEFNLKPAWQGAVGMWDSVVRIGGAASTGEVLNCNLCKAAFLLIHITPSGSGYFENLWLWTADHSIDQGGAPDINTGRGILVESTDPTWLVAMGVEHNTLYAYNVVNARNVFLGLAQVETPYWQPSPAAPVGWLLNSKYHDPIFSNCNGRAQCAMSWGLRIVAGRDIFSYGTGVWLFFNGWTGDCAQNDGNCQESVVSIEGIPQNLVLYNVNAKSAQNVLTVNSQLVAPRVPWNRGSWGAVVAGYLRFSGKRNA